MSEEATRNEGMKISVMSGWELLYKTRLYLVVLLIIVVFILFPVEINQDWQYAFIGLIASTGVTYALIKFKMGYVINTDDMSNGKIGLRELDKQELDQKLGTCLSFASPLGTVIVEGEHLYTETGEKTSIHSLLEVKTNSALANRCLQWTSENADLLMEYKRTSDGIVMDKTNRGIELWRNKMRMEPESLTSNLLSKKSQDSSPPQE